MATTRKNNSAGGACGGGYDYQQDAGVTDLSICSRIKMSRGRFPELKRPGPKQDDSKNQCTNPGLVLNTASSSDTKTISELAMDSTSN